MEQKQLQVAHPGDESSKVGESIFYMIVLLSILPTISGLISDFFRTQYLREIEVSVLGMTGYIETVLTAMTAMLGIGAQANRQMRWCILSNLHAFNGLGLANTSSLSDISHIF